jgi:hypothetical protein
MTSDIVVHRGEVGTIRHFDVESGKFEVHFKHSNENLHLLPEEFTRLKTFMENQKQEGIKNKETSAAAAEQGTRQLLSKQESSCTTVQNEEPATAKIVPSPIVSSVVERKDANMSHMSVLVDDKAVAVAGHITEEKGIIKTFRSAKI